jgi:hypothetical protein
MSTTGKKGRPRAQKEPMLSAAAVDLGLGEKEQEGGEKVHERKGLVGVPREGGVLSSKQRIPI